MFIKRSSTLSLLCCHLRKLIVFKSPLLKRSNHLIPQLSISLLITVLASACQLSRLSNYFSPSTPTAKSSLKEPAPQQNIKGDLRIISASYSLDLTPAHNAVDESGGSNSDQSFSLETRLKLSLIHPGQKREANFTLKVPTSLAAQLKVKRGCTLTANRKVESTDDHEMTVKCSPNGEGTYVLHLSVRAPYTEMSGLETISEGEREYHIVYLPKRLTSTFLVGFGHPTPFPRNVTITSSKRLRLFGHGRDLHFRPCT